MTNTKPHGIYFPVTHSINLSGKSIETIHYSFMWDYWVYSTHTHFENKKQASKAFVLQSSLV
ncbi:hypothetical protein [Lacticaseibacillus paracasei]|uniref:hypothetical protein n=1 Tax=Lacticaseibacillus paracasei TaxID=1597 RepID=UPI003CFA0995